MYRLHSKRVVYQNYDLYRKLSMRITTFYPKLFNSHTTSCTIKNYICLTTHYVDCHWMLCSKNLNFFHLPPPHNRFELYKKISRFL